MAMTKGDAAAVRPPESPLVTTDDGVHRPTDAIICATCFETSSAKGPPIHGEDGINLRDRYAHRPKTYLGLCTNNSPNFFQSLGPNSFQGAGSLLIMMEQAHKYMAEILRRMALGNMKTIQPKRKHVNNFSDYCDEYFRRTVYTADCVSWYKTQDRVTALWPGSSVHALHALESVRLDDFGWFGNGSTAGETNVVEKTEALTWCLDGTNFLGEPVDGKETGSDEIKEIPERDDGNCNDMKHGFQRSSEPKEVAESTVQTGVKRSKEAVGLEHVSADAGAFMPLLERCVAHLPRKIIDSASYRSTHAEPVHSLCLSTQRRLEERQ